MINGRRAGSIFFSAAASIGFRNVFRVALYRLALKTRLHPVVRLAGRGGVGPYYTPGAHAKDAPPPRQGWREKALYFSWFETPLEGPPDWLANPFRKDAKLDATRLWWTVSDFDPVIGDIKAVWEASRFDWLIAMAQRAALGEMGELQRLNAWLDDWGRANPPYLGPNWKCGQEASIRVMHLALAAMLLGQAEHPPEALQHLIRLHLCRIAPTMAYALGQQNNHGTSEAAALFIGGSLLERCGVREGRRWSQQGRRWLENRAKTLIEPDGTFSQYSVNYHRMVLDTYSLAEAWRRRLDLPPFSARMMERVSAAVRWLFELTDPQTGDAPNLGANDGARLIALTDTDYRDFRPSVQLAAIMFSRARAYAPQGDWDIPAAWLGVASPSELLPSPASRSFVDGGLHVLRRGRALAFLRYPHFRFRPSQADALHLDLWLDGANVLRDGGTFSYNISDEDAAYFNGAPAHNTVEVDGRNQMPRISRFLFGAWLKAYDVVTVREDGETLTAAAAYRDAWGATVLRQVWLSNDCLVCRDEVGGSAARAVLRWRLAPGEWNLADGVVSGSGLRLAVETSAPVTRLELVQGYESRLYLNKMPLPVLEVEISAPCVLTTCISF